MSSLGNYKQTQKNGMFFCVSLIDTSFFIKTIFHRGPSVSSKKKRSTNLPNKLLVWKLPQSIRKQCAICKLLFTKANTSSHAFSDITHQVERINDFTKKLRINTNKHRISELNKPMERWKCDYRSKRWDEEKKFNKSPLRIR